MCLFCIRIKICCLIGIERDMACFLMRLLVLCADCFVLCLLVGFVYRMEMELGKLFIGGISWDTNEDRLKEYFRAFGDVLEAVIMKDRATGRARGFGFVVFADPAVAERVVMEKHLIDGRNVSCYVLILNNLGFER